MTLKVTIKQDSMTPAVEKAIAGLTSGGMVQLNRALADEFMAITFSAFGAGGTNRPAYWPDLSKKYQKAIQYFGRPKLILTGELSTSINLLELNAQFAEVGTDTDYAAAQQFGDASRNLPPRPYFPVYGDGLGSVTLTDYAERRMREAALRQLARFGLME